MDAQDYPLIRALVGGYFHQDVDLDSVSDTEIWRSFARTHWRAENIRLVEEVAAFLARSEGDPLARFETMFRPDLQLADSDAGLRIWLESAARTIADAPSAGETAK